MRGFLGCVVGAVILYGCGSGSSNNSGSKNNSPTHGTGTSTATLTVSGFSFSPANLSVAPGTTVNVQNTDSAPHSVTSQGAVDLFTPGAVAGVQFDTGAFTGTRSFTVPATATAGTVIPYYCSVHKGMMANRGSITVVAAGATTGGTGGTGGGGY